MGHLRAAVARCERRDDAAAGDHGVCGPIHARAFVQRFCRSYSCESDKHFRFRPMASCGRPGRHYRTVYVAIYGTRNAVAASMRRFESEGCAADPYGRRGALALTILLLRLLS